MEPLRKELAEGVFLTYVPAAKFKTGVLGAQLITPLEESTVAAGALLPAVLRRGTTAHRDMRSIAAELDRLYGASVAYTVRKKGENQCLGFVGSFLDERYVPGGERLLEPMADLLGELLLDPLTRNGRFLADYVESEKENLIDAIESILNDKRDYADARLLQEMCRGERYGIDRLGTVEGVEKLTNQTLYRYYSELLATARIELFYCGSADCARVEGALDRALAALPRERVAEPAVAERVGAPETVREITETMDVTQAKLAMGYRAASEDTPALLLANLIFGGYSNSKLFLNVREKLSLCYYASSGYHRSKGIITVSSGIEAQNYEVARREIAAQLEAGILSWTGCDGAVGGYRRADRAARGRHARARRRGGAEHPARHGLFPHRKGGRGAMKWNETNYPRIGETVLRTTLPNGLTVAVVPKPLYRKRYAFFTTRYGGMDMRFRLDGVWHDTPAGIAHYLEHKMFDTEDGNALQELSQNGAEPNAFTSNATTAYYFDCTEHFEENLKILLSFVSVPYFTQESVDKERGIIGQEIRMVEDTPDWRVYTNLLECLYHSSPARVAIAGTVESIAEITPKTLYACHKAFYDPANMMLCVVGDVKPDEIAAIAEEILPNSRGEVIERDYGQEDMRVVEKCRREAMEVSMPQFLVGFKCPPAADGAALMRQDIIADIACDILLGDSSPLYQRLYDKGLINGSFGGGFDQLPGIAYLYAGGDSDAPETVVRAILDEAQRLAREGVDEAFYQQLRRASFGSTLRALNSFENIAVSVADGAFRGFDPFRFPEVYDSVTRADVEAFLRESIVEERNALSILIPKKEGASQ